MIETRIYTATAEKLDVYSQMVRPNALTPIRSKKTILTDVDGVLTSWQSALPYFLKDCRLPIPAALYECMYSEVFLKPTEIFLNKDGSDMSYENAMALLEEYNQSDYIKYLPAYHDALEVVNRLKDEYHFVAISALSDVDSAWDNRMYNLNTLFSNAFKDLHLSGSMKSKTKLFEDVINDIGTVNIACYIDDLSPHLDDYRMAWEDISSDNPTIFQMNRRVQIPNSDNSIIQVSDWYEIEYYL
jgi:FMN phosphatase YigB (HAD superfamily)